MKSKAYLLDNQLELAVRGAGYPRDYPENEKYNRPVLSGGLRSNDLFGKASMTMEDFARLGL